MTFIAQPVSSVLELFKGPLSGMRFADVDAEGLALLVSKVESAGSEVASTEAKLAELRQRLATEQEALLAFAQRALAYARVYAETHEELLAELNGISLPRLAKPRKATASKAADPESAVQSSPAPVESGSAQAGAEPPTAVETREVELDPERNGLDATHSPNVRKSRRNRLAATDTPLES
jgi:hypothetical protein